MKLLVCGDRNWTDLPLIYNIISTLHESEKITTIIHGACRGADLMAAACAKELNIPEQPFPAEWDKFGRSADPKRNREMLTKGKPDLVIAFHENLEESKGTKNMISLAEKAGIAYHIYNGRKDK